MKKITAVVVTYNRLKLLGDTIRALKNQTRKLDNIIVINNGCTDGTKEWLELQEGLDVVNQENVGGSGGYYTGVKYAYEKGYDWVWTMDDDVYPADDCLETLLKYDSPEVGILCPEHIDKGEHCTYEYKKLDLKHWTKPLHQAMITKEDVKTKETISIMSMTFEGPLIKRETIEKIGFPNKDIFILYDDTDYSYRTTLINKKVLLVVPAIINRADLASSLDIVTLRNKNVWKMSYEIRNYSYFNHHYGQTWGVRHLRSLASVFYYTIVFLSNIFNKKYTWKNFIDWHKARINGINEKLGKIG